MTLSAYRHYPCSDADDKIAAAVTDTGRQRTYCGYRFYLRTAPRSRPALESRHA